MLTEMYTSRPEANATATVSPYGALGLLLEAQSDVLLFLDSYSAIPSSYFGGTGVLEVIAAGTFESISHSSNHYHNFIKALALELRELKSLPSFSPLTLYRRIYTRIRNAPRLVIGGLSSTPVHLTLSPSTNHRSIQISPLKKSISEGNRSHTSMGVGTGTEHLPTFSSPEFMNAKVAVLPRAASSLKVPSLTFSARLRDGTTESDLSAESFTEWLRMAPAVIEEFKVEAVVA